MPQHTSSEKCKCSLTSYLTFGKQKRYFVQKFRGQNIQCAQKMPRSIMPRDIFTLHMIITVFPEITVIRRVHPV